MHVLYFARQVVFYTCNERRIYMYFQMLNLKSVACKPSSTGHIYAYPIYRARQKLRSPSHFFFFSSFLRWAHAVYWLLLLYVNSYLVIKRWRLNEELIIEVCTLRIHIPRLYIDIKYVPLARSFNFKPMAVYSYEAPRTDDNLNTHTHVHTCGEYGC